jgi:hypothetical protein
MLGHADIGTTAIYLNVQVGGLKERMRKTDERRSPCNPVANESSGEQPPLPNAAAMETSKSLIN